MADGFLENQRKFQVSSLPLIRRSGADKFVPVATKSSTNEDVIVMPHQAAGQAFESQVFWQSYTSYTTVTSTAFSTAGIQDANVQMASFQLKTEDLNITDMYLEWDTTQPTQSSTTYCAIVPGPLWIDRINCRFDGGNQFQTLYGDVMFRLLLLSVTPTKLYQYALASGYWINPPNMPGNADKSSPAFTQATSGTYAVTFTNAEGTYPSGQQKTAVWNIFPYSPKTGVTNYPDTSGTYLHIRIPLIGLFIQQLGIFQGKWINGGYLYLDVYTAGRPIFNTAVSSSDYTIASFTNFRLLCRCLSFPGMSRSESMLQNIQFSKRGLHLMYLDWYRTYQTVAATPVSGQQALLDLNFTVGRKVVCIFVICRGYKSSFSGNGWLLTLDKEAFQPDSTTTSNSNATRHAYLGQRCLLGDRAADLPSVEVLNSNGQSLYSQGFTTSAEHWKIERVTDMYPNNPWAMGLVPGQTCFAPLYVSDIPIHFGNVLKAVQGISDGTQEFNTNCKLRITFGANPNTQFDTYDIYYGFWRNLHINNGMGGKPKINLEGDIAHQARDV